jgi:hypothetical protein
VMGTSHPTRSGIRLFATEPRRVIVKFVSDFENPPSEMRALGVNFVFV